MEMVGIVLKYTFVVALAAEAVLIARALVRLAREKARPAQPDAAGE